MDDRLWEGCQNPYVARCGRAERERERDREKETNERERERERKREREKETEKKRERGLRHPTRDWHPRVSGQPSRSLGPAGRGQGYLAHKKHSTP